MAISHVGPVAAANLGAFMGVSKANISAINGITASFGGGSGGAAIPTVRAVGAANADVGAITLTLPSGTAANDILVALFITQNTQAITMSGYTVLSEQDAGTIRLTVMWKRAGGGEGNPTSSDSGAFQLGRLIAIQGCVTSGDPWDVTNTGSTGTGTTGTINGATTTWANSLVLQALGITRAGTPIASSGQTNADLSSVTEQMDNSTSLGTNGGSMMLATGGKAAAGAYGTMSVTLSSSQTWVGWTGALKGA